MQQRVTWNAGTPGKNQDPCGCWNMGTLRVPLNTFPLNISIAAAFPTDPELELLWSQWVPVTVRKAPGPAARLSMTTPEIMGGTGQPCATTRTPSLPCCSCPPGTMGWRTPSGEGTEPCVGERHQGGTAYWWVAAKRRQGVGGNRE